jgi:hypothetical protein
VLWLERQRGQCGHGADRKKRRDVDTVPPRRARIAKHSCSVTKFKSQSTILVSGKNIVGPWLITQHNY